LVIDHLYTEKIASLRMKTFAIWKRFDDAGQKLREFVPFEIKFSLFS